MNFRQLRIGVPQEYIVAELAPEVREAWGTTLRLLQDSGHTLVPVSLPTTKLALSAYYIIAPAEASSNLAKYDGVRYGTRSDEPDGADGLLFSKTRGQGFGNEVKRRILLGSYTLSADAIDNYFIQAQKVRRLVQQDFDRIFRQPNILKVDDLSTGWNEGGVDLLVCPTAPTLPPSLAEVEQMSPLQAYVNDVFTVPASLAGLPAISMPYRLGGTAGQAPQIGIQIIGQFGMDALVCRVAQFADRDQKIMARLASKNRKKIPKFDPSDPAVRKVKNTVRPKRSRKVNVLTPPHQVISKDVTSPVGKTPKKKPPKRSRKVNVSTPPHPVVPKDVTSPVGKNPKKKPPRDSIQSDTITSNDAASLMDVVHEKPTGAGVQPPVMKKRARVSPDMTISDYFKTLQSAKGPTNPSKSWSTGARQMRILKQFTHLPPEVQEMASSTTHEAAKTQPSEAGLSSPRSQKSVAMSSPRGAPLTINPSSATKLPQTTAAKVKLRYAVNKVVSSPSRPLVRKYKLAPEIEKHDAAPQVGRVRYMQPPLKMEEAGEETAAVKK
jgi:hypothetical protein